MVCVGVVVCVVCVWGGGVEVCVGRGEVCGCVVGGRGCVWGCVVG